MKVASVVAVCALVSPALAEDHAETFAEQRARELEQLQQRLSTNCPRRKVEIATLSTVAEEKRASALVHLAPCGNSEMLFHHALGEAYFTVREFRLAEASFRKAMSFGVTESDQAGLLMAISRQETLTKKQRTDARKHLEYFRTNSCSRADICGSVAYAAFHFDDLMFTRVMAERAIELGTDHWVPYQLSGMAFAADADADVGKARRRLLEAKQHGAPAKYVDPFLETLGAAPSVKTAPVR